MRIAIIALSLTVTVACLPTYDPDETPFQGGGNNGANNGGEPTCENATQEVCDGVDNDCDGQVDEDFPRRGVQCGINIGVCAGVTVCDGGEEVCFAVAEPSEELCDGLDNDCDGQTDELVDTDPENCGACGNVCAFENGTAECAGGECVLLGCEDGFAECDRDPTNGCETDTSSDPTNCGGCGNLCSFPAAVAVCTGGACALESCAGGLEDCNEVTLDGCEADLTSDANNCKACGVVCGGPNAVGICAEEGCAIQGCVDGFADVDGDGVNGCEMGLATVGAPPDGALQQLSVGNGVLWGAAGPNLRAYALDAQGAIGAVVGETTLASRVHQMYAADDVLYVAEEFGDVRIYNVTDATAPNQVGLVGTSGPSAGFRVRGDWLFVADGRDGLRVADVSSPSAPRVLAHVPTPSDVRQVHLSGDLALLNSPERSDVYLYDVSDPRAPQYLGTFPTRTPFDIATFSGDLLATASSNSASVYLYRVQPDAVTWLGSDATLAGSVRALEQRFPFLVTVTGGDSVNIELIDLRRPQVPVATDRFTAGARNAPRAAVFSGTNAYVAGNAGLQRFGVEDPRAPTELQDDVSTVELRDVAVRGNTLVIAAEGAVEVLDNTNADNPVRRTRFGDSVRKVHLTESALYVISDAPAVAGYFLSQLDNPDPSAYVQVEGERPIDVETSADGRYIYGLYGTQLRLFEGMALQSPQRAAVDLNATCREVIRHPQQSTLYLACSTGVLVVNPDNQQLTIIGTPGGGDVYDIQLFGQMMYGAVDGGVSVYNVFNATDVNHASTVTIGSGVRHISVQSEWVVVGTSNSAMLLPRALELGEAPVIPTRTFSGSIVTLQSTLTHFYAGTQTGPYRLVVESGR